MKKEDIKNEKSLDKDAIRLIAIQTKIETPKDLQRFLPVDEIAVELLELDTDEHTKNIEQYFFEQISIKTNVIELYAKLEKEINDYATNCQKLLEYVKEIKK